MLASLSLINLWKMKKAIYIKNLFLKENACFTLCLYKFLPGCGIINHSWVGLGWAEANSMKARHKQPTKPARLFNLQFRTNIYSFSEVIGEWCGQVRTLQLSYWHICLEHFALYVLSFVSSPKLNFLSELFASWKIFVIKSLQRRINLWGEIKVNIKSFNEGFNVTYDFNNMFHFQFAVFWYVLLIFMNHRLRFSLSATWRNLFKNWNFHKLKLPRKDFRQILFQFKLNFCEIRSAYNNVVGFDKHSISDNGRQ